MKASSVRLLSTIGLATTVLAHGVHNIPRAANCGPAYGGAVCDAGQCCSSAGVCGTGSICIAPDCLFQYGPGCDANQTPPGTNTASVSRPKLGNVPYGAIITKCNTPGKVALTFDDGPYTYTAELLDLLKKNNVKATFFITANNGGKGQIENESTGYPALLKRMLSEGHQLAGHTWSHQDLSTLSQQQIRDQMIKSEIAFQDVFGFFPTYMRPPYGRCYGDCLTTLGNLGYHVITWNLDTNDWKGDYGVSQSTFSGAMKSSNPSSDSFIPLAHDVQPGTVHGFAQYMIDALRKAGYSTALVGECLNDPKENWYRDAKSGQAWGGSVSSSNSNSPQQAGQPAANNPPTTTTSTTSTSSSTSTSTTTTHTTSSKTFSSVQASITLHPLSPQLNATLTNGTQPLDVPQVSSAAACASGTGACILAGLGAADGVRGSSSATSTAAASGTVATQRPGSSASHLTGNVAQLLAIPLVWALFT